MSDGNPNAWVLIQSREIAVRMPFADSFLNMASFLKGPTHDVKGAPLTLEGCINHHSDLNISHQKLGAGESLGGSERQVQKHYEYETAEAKTGWELAKIHHAAPLTCLLNVCCPPHFID